MRFNRLHSLDSSTLNRDICIGFMDQRKTGAMEKVEEQHPLDLLDHPGTTCDIVRKKA